MKKLITLQTFHKMELSNAEEYFLDRKIVPITERWDEHLIKIN